MTVPTKQQEPAVQPMTATPAEGIPAAAQLRGQFALSMVMDPPPDGPPPAGMFPEPDPVQDAAIYFDAMGISPPAGLPAAALLSERIPLMAEPSSAAAGGFALWKAFGGLAIVGGIAAFFSAVVAMCMMTPRSPKEWAVGLTCTAIGSLCGGAYAILKLGLHRNLPEDPVSLFLALMSAGGIMFACGLPAWALVRALFTFLEKRRDKGLDEIVADARKVVAP